MAGSISGGYGSQQLIINDSVYISSLIVLSIYIHILSIFIIELIVHSQKICVGVYTEKVYKESLFKIEYSS